MKRLFFRNSKGVTLAGDYYPARSNILVIVCHGFKPDRKHPLYRAICRAVNAAGFRVFSFDFTGWGESEGSYYNMSLESQTQDLRSAVDFVFSKKLCDKVVVCGHSLGGAVAINGASSDSRVSGLILIAPALDRRKWWKRYEKKGTIKYFDNYLLINKFKFSKEFLKNGETFLYSKARELKMPVLLAHGTRDKSCRYSNSKKFFRLLGASKQFSTVTGADHNFSASEHKTELTNAINDWLSRNF